MRYDMLNCNRPTGLKTPNLDCLAAQGVRFGSVLTTERYLGCKQNPEKPVNDCFACLFAFRTARVEDVPVVAGAGPQSARRVEGLRDGSSGDVAPRANDVKALGVGVVGEEAEVMPPKMNPWIRTRVRV